MNSAPHNPRSGRSNVQSGSAPDAPLSRQDRQRTEILVSIDAGRLHRAADLAHEHLAEFPSDRSVHSAVTAALDRSPDDHIRRRVVEFASR